MLDNTLSTRILKAVDAGFEEQVAFYKTLWQPPSARAASRSTAGTWTDATAVHKNAVCRRRRRDRLGDIAANHAHEISYS